MVYEFRIIDDNGTDEELLQQLNEAGAAGFKLRQVLPPIVPTSGTRSGTPFISNGQPARYVLQRERTA